MCVKVTKQKIEAIEENLESIEHHNREIRKETIGLRDAIESLREDQTDNTGYQ